MSTDALTTRTVEHARGALILAVGGEVDMVTSAQLRNAVDDLVARCPTAVIVDLSAVTFLASAGLQILAAAAERFFAAGRFVVVADGPETSRPIELTKLNEVFALHPTLQDALVDLGLTGHSSTESTS